MESIHHPDYPPELIPAVDMKTLVYITKEKLRLIAESTQSPQHKRWVEDITADNVVSDYAFVHDHYRAYIGVHAEKASAVSPNAIERGNRAEIQELLEETEPAILVA